MSNKFIVIEGLDGAGKSTQIKLLKKYFVNNNIDFQYLHFPRTDSPIYGELISKFLQGEFGYTNEVNPYLVALLYAGDRNETKDIINNYMKNNLIVLVDRYVYSNIAFQCAKFSNLKKKEKLESWILNLEYKHNKIPKPFLSLYLRVPFDFVSKKLNNVRSGEERSYLNGKKDIHESDLTLQKDVEKEYLKLIEKYDDIVNIDCFTQNKGINEPQIIHERIIDLLFKKGLLS